MSEHNVAADYAGFMQDKPRLTCYICNRTLVRQPYMTFGDWRERVNQFLARHPSSRSVGIKIKLGL